MDSQGKIGFILSNGRSGSTTLHAKLKFAPNSVVLHEPEGTQDLIDTVMQGHLTGWHFSKEEIFAYLRKEGIERVLHAGKSYVEATPMLAELSEAIPKVFPGVRILWLYRDPKAWLRSAMHVGWQYTLFDKNCLMWETMTSSIMKAYLSLPLDQRAMLDIKNMSNDLLRRSIFPFFGLEWDKECQEWATKDFRGHTYKGPKWFPHPDDWTEEELVPYRKLVEPLYRKMRGLYEKEAITRWHQ